MVVVVAVVVVVATVAAATVVVMNDDDAIADGAGTVMELDAPAWNHVVTPTLEPVA